MPESKSIVLAKKIARLVIRNEDRFNGVNFMALRIAEEILNEHSIETMNKNKAESDAMQEKMYGHFEEKNALGSRCEAKGSFDPKKYSSQGKSSINGG